MIELNLYRFRIGVYGRGKPRVIKMTGKSSAGNGVPQFDDFDDFNFSNFF